MLSGNTTNSTQGDVDDVSLGKYGTLGVMLSEDFSKRNATFVDLSQLASSDLVNQSVWVSGRVHTSRGKGINHQRNEFIRNIRHRRLQSQLFFFLRRKAMFPGAAPTRTYHPMLFSGWANYQSSNGEVCCQVRFAQSAEDRVS